VFDDDIVRLRDKELCAAVTFQTIEKHLDEGHIHFSFLIKKNCKETLNIKAPVVSEKQSVVLAKASSHSVPSKGILKANNSRKGPSIPSDPRPPTVIVVYREPQEEPLKNLPSKQNSQQQPPEYSSINKHEDERHFKSPAHSTAAINKNDDDLVSKFRSRSLACFYNLRLLCHKSVVRQQSGEAAAAREQRRSFQY
jgi:hypothetical protein